MGLGIGADSETGCLRTALMHRPGRELSRITPRTRDLLRMPALPWVARAQHEHDLLADALRDHGVEVLYLTGLLQDVLEYQAARAEAIASALGNAELGGELAAALRGHLEGLGPEDLAVTLTGGLATDELKAGHGLVYDLLDPRDFVLEPLPNLVFSRDGSTWAGDQAITGTLPGPRRRESDLIATIYGHHPRFAGVSQLRAQDSPLHCGDMVLLGPGVVAAGVGARTTAASVELLARRLLDVGSATHVLVIPTAERAKDKTFDQVCSVLAPGVVLMNPAHAFTLTALTITGRSGELTISRPRPFLEAAARALGIDQLTAIGTGIESAQWDDGGNTLAIGDGQLICDERNSETNARLAGAGFRVTTVPGGELGGIRGGPRAMCVPLLRDPLTTAGHRENPATISNEHTIPPSAGMPLPSLAVSDGELAPAGASER